MTLFIALMVVGLTGLVLMAFPAFGRHAHIGGAHGIGHAAGHGALHGPASGISHAGAHAAGAHAAQAGSDAATNGLAGRFIPSPRMIFSFLTLFGAFGNLFTEQWHMAAPLAGFLALAPAMLIERFAATPLWNMLLSFQAKPCSPLEELVLAEAQAVTPFRNGKGLVSVVRDGRLIQLTAQLPEAQAGMPVRVGDRLLVEDVDAAHERVMVSIR